MLRVSESIWRTDTGRQRRENQDSVYVDAPLFVVADGMGGAQAGEVASRIAIETFEEAPSAAAPSEARLADLVRAANHRIHDRSRAEQSRAGMGTTLTAACLEDGRLAIAHVGDSRAYLFRDGELTRLTQDHSLVDELVRQGKLTEEQAAEHPQRSIITRALGPEPEVEVDTWSYPVRAADVMLLCSDGLTSMVAEERVAEILASTDHLDEVADRLIQEANDAGGRDNITVILSRFEEAPEETSVDQPTMVGEMASPSASPAPGAGELGRKAAVPAAAVAAPRPRGARTGSGAANAAPPVSPRPNRQPREHHGRRFPKAAAAAVTILILLFLIGGGGYLASRQLYFIGTNAQGIVTVYRGFPYDLPAGVNLYETYFVSGVPASLVPADRRSEFFDNQLRSQTTALNLVRELELGNISR